MGLAGPKNRTKISADPNNTHWSKSTDRFGHKILLKQGWTPGSFLGAKDAKHAAHYTAANASHIRVAVKDDNLGLGAKRGKADNETFGLSAFQGLLGRLNGKSDGELKKEESAQRDLKLKVYTNQRWGGIRFVSGGLLVGDKIEVPKNKDGAVNQAVVETQDAEAPPAEKKRKRSERDQSGSALKEKRRKKDLLKESDLSSQDDNGLQAKKSGSKKSQKPNPGTSSTDNAAMPPALPIAQGDKENVDKKARREAKKARKLERLARKGAKEAQKAKRKEKKKAAAESSSDSSASEEETAASMTTSAATSGTSTPTPGFAGGRLAVRQRYIAQKKKAAMDPQALKEIFMIKAEA